MKDKQFNPAVSSQAYILAAALHHNGCTKWIEGRRSKVYEVYEGDIKKWMEENEPEKAPVKLTSTTTDPFKKGYRLLTTRTLYSSFHAYLTKRVKRMTSSLYMPVNQTTGWDSDDEVDYINHDEPTDEEAFEYYVVD